MVPIDGGAHDVDSLCDNQCSSCNFDTAVHIELLGRAGLMLGDVDGFDESSAHSRHIIREAVVRVKHVVGQLLKAD